jgi:hypothetical protein
MFAKCPAGRPGTAEEVANVAELLTRVIKVFSLQVQTLCVMVVLLPVITMAH